MQIFNFLITALVNLAVGFVLFFFLLLAFNGYSERQAMPGFIVYILWTLFISLAAAGFSVLCAKFMINKWSFNSVAAVAINAPIFIVIGGAAIFFGLIIAGVVTEQLR